MVEEICRRLDRIPLAVELAASRMSSMTADDIRGRLDHRFRLLVGSRRGLERHQTLRHAVQWSYDLLDAAEKMLLDRCSVFVGGFELESACAVAGSDDIDDFAVLDLLDALVRKSLLVADRSSGHTRFSMLETIRQFAEEQLVARGEADQVRAAHARHFAEQEGEITALWDSPRQREAVPGSPPSSRTCAPRSDGPRTTTISPKPPPSRFTGRPWAMWAASTSRLAGPRSWSSPPGPSTIPGSWSYTKWRRIAGWSGNSRRLSAMRKPARQF